MNCLVIPFPAPPADRCRAIAPHAALAADRIADQHLLLLDTAAQLLSLDDAAFSERIARMRGAEDQALLADLADGFNRAAVDLDVASRGIFVVRARLAAFAPGGTHER